MYLLRANMIPTIFSSVLCPIKEVGDLASRRSFADDGSAGDAVDALIGNDIYAQFLGDGIVGINEHIDRSHRNSLRLDLLKPIQFPWKFKTHHTKNVEHISVHL